MNVDSGLHAGNDRKRAFFLAKIILVRLHDNQNDAQKHDRERQVRHQQRRGAGKRVRTTSTSRKSDCQWFAGLDSSMCSGSPISLSNRRWPTRTSTRKATDYIIRDRAMRRM